MVGGGVGVLVVVVVWVIVTADERGLGMTLSCPFRKIYILTLYLRLSIIKQPTSPIWAIKVPLSSAV